MASCPATSDSLCRACAKCVAYAPPGFASSMPPAQSSWFQPSATLKTSCGYLYVDSGVLSAIDSGASSNVVRVTTSDIVSVLRAGCTLKITLKSGTTLLVLRSAGEEDAIKKLRALTKVLFPGLLTDEADV